MIFSFNFSNLCGNIYKSGNIVFSKHKNILYSPIGNKLSVLDLENNICNTLPFQSRSDISRICVSPDSKLLIIVDVDGYGQVINMISNNVINHFNFKEPLNDIQFSPDGKFLGTCSDVDLRIYESPQLLKSIEPLILYKKYKGRHSDKITKISWSSDSRFITTCSNDLTSQIHAIHRIDSYIPFTFTGHKSPCIKGFFSEDMKYYYTLTKDGYFFIWKWVDDMLTQEYENYKKYQGFKKGKKIKVNEIQEQNLMEINFMSEFEKNVNKGRFILEKKHQFYVEGSKVKSADFHQDSKLLIIGFKNGTFGVYSIRDIEITNIQSFAITDTRIDTISISHSGAWIAFGVKKLGQLLVWEWRSQTYIFNQQGLTFNTDCFDFSPNGKIIATGGNDGKIRLWDTKSNMCFQTFSEHISKVTDLKFSSNQNTLVSCSNDGTVRAFDTLRYRNFRVMKAEVPVQFTCVAIDPSGEMVSAGGFDPYNIYCWSLQTGNLLEVITGHEAPIVQIQYSPLEDILASASWDKKIRIHHLYSRRGNTDVLDHNSEVTCFTFRPDGKQLCSGTLKGEIYFWDVENAQTVGVIDCKRDLDGGRLENQKTSTKNATFNKYYKTLCYSADGEYILAGGNSKYVNFYDISTRILLKKQLLSQNRSLDGVLRKLNSKNLNKTQNQQDTDSEYDERKDNVLPGSKQPDFMKAKSKLKMECKSVKFSPGGRQWAAATTEGLHIYSAEHQSFFTPYELDEGISKVGAVAQFKKNDFYNSLIMSMQLNDQPLMQKIFINIDPKEIKSVSRNIPQIYILRLLTLINTMVEQKPDIEFNLVWLHNLLIHYSSYFQNMDANNLNVLKSLLKSVSNKYEYVNQVTNQNNYAIEYIKTNIELIQNTQ